MRAVGKQFVWFLPGASLSLCLLMARPPRVTVATSSVCAAPYHWWSSSMLPIINAWPAPCHGFVTKGGREGACSLAASLGGARGACLIRTQFVACVENRPWSARSLFHARRMSTGRANLPCDRWRSASQACPRSYAASRACLACAAADSDDSDDEDSDDEDSDDDKQSRLSR